MPINENYDFITRKLQSLKSGSTFLKTKEDPFAFTALCVKSNFYKNPSLIFNDETIKDFLVDGVSDGGVDAILIDPNNRDSSDLVLIQSKYYQNISFDDVQSALLKLITFYKNMEQGRYETVNSVVQRRFISLNAEVGEESKIHFVFYTSAPKNSIRKDRLEKLIKDNFRDPSRFDLSLYFDKDIIEEIKESESRRPSVERGQLMIDDTDNVLWYDDDAVIVNISAFSLKSLYAEHNNNLLSQNLRYFVKKADLDGEINLSIRDNPEKFWFKNNGLTIVCDDFDVDGKLVKLQNFSIVNGGQTTYLISKSEYINKDTDLFLPCKIVRTLGETVDERFNFSLEIAKATNSQKAIKTIDLKSNSPEQIRFVNAMREVGVFYQTKRGESIPREYSLDYQNSDLADVGKLCLAGIFQMPAASRNKPSTLYLEPYYNVIFNSKQNQIARFVKDLLYIDYYFRKMFLSKYDRDNENDPKLTFAHNARTLCIAFVALASRIANGNITNEEMFEMFAHLDEEKAYDNHMYDIFRDLGEQEYVFSPSFEKENGKDKIDEIMYDLFSLIIKEGYKAYSYKHLSDITINETNYLKNDKNYYNILKASWGDFKEAIAKHSEAFK